MVRVVHLVIAMLLVATAGVAVTETGVATAEPASPGATVTPVEPTASLDSDATAEVQQRFDRSIVSIRVHTDGSARWTFRYERTLETDEEREEFATYAEEFNENETTLYESFRSDAIDLVKEGSNETGREMAATEFSRNAEIQSSLGNEVGIVELSFTWGGFAEQDGDRVVVGDVFEGGLYVGPDQKLVIAAGDGLVFESVAPNGTQSNPESLRDSDTVTWTGEQQFTDQRPRVVFVPATSTTTTATTTDTQRGSTATKTGTEPGTASGDGPGWLLLLVAILIVAVGAVWYNARSPSGGTPLATLDPRGSDGDESGAATSSEKATGSGPPAEGSGGADERKAVAGSVETAGGVGAAAVNPDGTDGERPSDPDATAVGGTAVTSESMGEPTVPDEAFLSDEDRVQKLLRENGGRMKQVRIVEETGWSKSKVSVLLSEMEEEGTVSKLRVGRENVVSLQGHEPDAARSPFDQEDS